jgi:hypothetical protein
VGDGEPGEIWLDNWVRARDGFPVEIRGELKSFLEERSCEY